MILPVHKFHDRIVIIEYFPVLFVLFDHVIADHHAAVMGAALFFRSAQSQKTPDLTGSHQKNKNTGHIQQQSGIVSHTRILSSVPNLFSRIRPAPV